MNREKIVIIVITFNPNIVDFKKNLDILTESGFCISIIDNGSFNADEIENVIKSIDFHKKIALVKLSKNYGIGFAQNKAIKIFNKSDYYIFFDQDSNMSKKNIEKLLDYFKKIKEIDKNVVAVGPSQSTNKSNLKFKSVSKIISSGMLVPYESFEKVGLFNQRFFIDFIDYEWCWRALRMGNKIYQLNVGYNHETNGVKRKMGHTVDPFERLFYIYRNAFYIIFHENVFLSIKMDILIKLIGKLIFQIFLNKPFLRVKICIGGIYQGLRKNFNND